MNGKCRKFFVDNICLIQIALLQILLANQIIRANIFTKSFWLSAIYDSTTFCFKIRA